MSWFKFGLRYSRLIGSGGADFPAITIGISAMTIGTTFEVA